VEASRLCLLLDVLVQAVESLVKFAPPERQDGDVVNRQGSENSGHEVRHVQGLRRWHGASPWLLVRWDGQHSCTAYNLPSLFTPVENVQLARQFGFPRAILCPADVPSSPPSCGLHVVPDENAVRRPSLAPRVRVARSTLASQRTRGERPSAPAP